MLQRRSAVSDDDLAYLTASRALALFATRELSPVELLDVLIARSEQVEPHVNAFAATTFEAARSQAALSEQRWMKGQARPLEGLPLALKDESWWAGHVVANGSLLYRDRVADTNEPVVERVLNAGAVIHAQTTTPEMSSMAVTWSRLNGVTRNPWSLEHSPGGSSGGAGASLAAGTTTLAIGSDLAGSIRIPASFCGVVGYKPPYGRVPQMAPYNRDTYCHVGPMARSVADAALLLDVIAGPTLVDHASLPSRPRLGTPSQDVSGLRVGVCAAPGNFEVAPAIQNSVRHAAEVLKEAGVQVQDIQLPIDREDVADALAVHLSTTYLPDAADAVMNHSELLCDYTIADWNWLNAAAANRSPLVGFDLEEKIWTAVRGAFQTVDVLLLPTTAVESLKADHDYYAEPLNLEGKTLDDPLHGFLAAMFNVVSRCPVLVVPSAPTPSGFPVGVQLVGPPYDDDAVFRVGAALEIDDPWNEITDRRPTCAG